jgi:argininosuccinate lyase
LQKGLPLTYNRDLQEDKPPVFWLDDTLGQTCRVLAGMIVRANFEPPPPTHLTDALAIAENLVRRGVPFRSAHATVGKLVALLAGRHWSAARPDELDGLGIGAEDLIPRPSSGGWSQSEQIEALRAQE